MYLSNSFSNDRYSLSREMCLTCARSLIRSGRGPWSPFPRPIKYWPIVYGVFSACVVLFLELCHSPESALPELRGEMRDAIAALR